MSDYNEFESKMKKTCDALTTQLATIRAGRANASVLDQIQVDYYGVPTPVQQLASVATPDPRSLVIQPWDASVLKGIEKAILASELGINPQNDGRMIRLVFPLSPRKDVRSWQSRQRSTARKQRSQSATSAVMQSRSSRSSRRRPR